MIAPVFVDTNVLIYARDSRNALKQQRAADWLSYLWREQLGRTSLQVLSEYYVNVTRKLRPGLAPDDAWDDVAALLAWRPQAMDEALMRQGHEIEGRFRLSWWDSLIVAAAQLQGCVVLLTEDLQDGGRFGGITVRSPFALAANEMVAAYSAGPVVRSRHAARGRPKTASR